MSKKSKKPTPAPTPIVPSGPPPRYTLFVTRDSDPRTGRLLDHVDAWFQKPDRIPNGCGAAWYAPGGLSERAGIWPLSLCRKHARTIPDDDRQCLRIEGDLLRGEDRAA